MRKAHQTFALYLPQYHPIPENDAWWGEGFTEWYNVVRARPRFRGHRQPQLPSSLGFYDLRVPDVYEKQCQIASEYGIDGFVFYHYWFSGKRLIDMPFERIRKFGSPLPVAICWANETWTRAWDGRERDVLIEQKYSKADHDNHVRYLVSVFSSSAYLRQEGRPVFFLYRPNKVEYLSYFISALRSACNLNGIDNPLVCSVRSGFDLDSKSAVFDPSLFDAYLDFQPNSLDFPSASNISGVISQAAKRLLPDPVYQKLKTSGSAVKQINYSALVNLKTQNSLRGDIIPRIPCCFPSWDNSARRNTPTVIQNDSPAEFGRWFQQCIDDAVCNPPGMQFTVINAWNEWAEGCHLEPDSDFGFSFLEEVRSRSSLNVSR